MNAIMIMFAHFFVHIVCILRSRSELWARHLFYFSRYQYVVFQVYIPIAVV